MSNLAGAGDGKSGPPLTSPLWEEQTLKKYTVLLIACFLIIVGCYESQVALSSHPVSKIDARLVNYWESVGKEKDANKIKLAIFKFNENEYLLNWKEGEQETIFARGFVSKIEDVKILNIQGIKSLDEKEKTYIFFRYEINEQGNLKVSIISDENSLLKDKKFKKPKEFRSFIIKNIHFKGLFGKTIEFKTIKEFKIEITL